MSETAADHAASDHAASDHAASDHAASDQARKGRRERRGRSSRLLAALVALLALGGAGLLWSGTRSHRPEPGRLPARAFALGVDQLPALTPGELPVGGAVAGTTSGTAASGGSGSGVAAANRLIIGSLGVNAPLVPQSITDGELAIPPDVHTVGRSTSGAAVDAELGTTLLAGHVNAADQGAGALASLYRVAPGAVVIVTDAQARMTAWRVVSLRTIPKGPDSLPQSIFAATGPRQLAIITCGGALLRVDGPHGAYNTYRDNIIATAVPVPLG